MELRKKNFKIIEVSWKIWFLRGEGSRKNMPKNEGAWTVCRFKKRLGKKESFGVLEGPWYPYGHYDGKRVFLSIFPKMPSEMFCSKICWQNSAKASFMYQQWTATVLIFLKVPTTDSLIFYSEYISRTAILTQASIITK